MRASRLIVISATWLCIAVGQTDEHHWRVSQQTDALRGTSFTRFILTGKFLTPPKRPTVPVPSLVVECIPGKRLRVYGGTFIDGYISLGVVLNSVVVEHSTILGGTSFPSAVLVSYRLDDGKIKQEQWNPSTDISGAFFPAVTLNTLLYGHFLPHKPGTTEPIKKVVIAVDEYLGGEIVMQFDMPDPTGVADACGSLYHKR